MAAADGFAATNDSGSTAAQTLLLRRSCGPGFSLHGGGLTARGGALANSSGGAGGEGSHGAGMRVSYEEFERVMSAVAATAAGDEALLRSAAASAAAAAERRQAAFGSGAGARFSPGSSTSGTSHCSSRHGSVLASSSSDEEGNGLGSVAGAMRPFPDRPESLDAIVALAEMRSTPGGVAAWFGLAGEGAAAAAAAAAVAQSGDEVRPFAERPETLGELLQLARNAHAGISAVCSPPKPQWQQQLGDDASVDLEPRTPALGDNSMLLSPESTFHQATRKASSGMPPLAVNLASPITALDH